MAVLNDSTECTVVDFFSWAEQKVNYLLFWTEYYCNFVLYGIGGCRKKLHNSRSFRILISDQISV